MESDLIRQINNGDKEAFKSLFNNYYPGLLFYANSIINDTDISKDLLQDIFLKIWEKHEEFSIQSSIKSYLYISLRNACLDFIKHEQVKKKYIDNAFLELKEIELKFYDTMVISQNEKIFEDCIEEIKINIEKLPEQCKEIFKLSRFKGMKNKEIARHLNLSIRTIDTQIYRALKFLRQKLNKFLSCT